MILIKFIAHSGILSRRKSEQAIKEGCVKVNGIVVTDPNYIVKTTDSVLCYNKKVIPHELVYILLNKPVGYLTSKSDPSGLPLITDLLPLRFRKIVDPVGRLDFNTSGALLLTNDGDLAHRLTHPKFNIKKKYIITTSRPLDQQLVDDIKSGVYLQDGMIQPDHIIWKEYSSNILTMTLHGGKYRIIRRLLQQFNVFVKKLHRLSFGPLTVSHMNSGSWRHLSPYEIKKLKS
jgi:23S rRNA pseudouridine2605 synthase